MAGAGCVTSGATMAPGGLEGLAASSTPTRRWGWSLLPVPAEDSRAGGPHSSSEPGLGARGSSWGRTTAPSPQLVQTGLGRVWPRQAAFQPSGSRLPQGLPKSWGPRHNAGAEAKLHLEPGRNLTIPSSLFKIIDLASLGRSLANACRKRQPPR